MSNTFTHAAAFALAAIVTTITVAGTNAIATQQFVKAETVAQAQAPMQVAQQIVVAAHRAA